MEKHTPGIGKLPRLADLLESQVCKSASTLSVGSVIYSDVKVANRDIMSGATGAEQGEAWRTGGAASSVGVLRDLPLRAREPHAEQKKN